MLNPVRVLQGVGGREEATEAVAQQNHLLDPDVLAPLLQGDDVLLLGGDGVGAERASGASTEP